jgi:uncharacterized protein YlzI (FlbEa/FlbD family)
MMSILPQKYFLAFFSFLFLWTSILGANTNPENIFYSFQNLSIVGQTNVNNFWLRYSKIESFKKIPTMTNITYLNGKSIAVSIPAHDFICSNHLMKNDFLSLIRADVSPDIDIQLQGIQGVANLKNDSTEVVIVNITLAGVKRSMDVYCSIVKDDANHFTLSGTRLVKLSDFNLIPPSKFFGLIKVKNEITIHFEIKLMVQGN